MAFGYEFRDIGSDFPQFNTLGSPVWSPKENETASIGTNGSILSVLVRIQQGLLRVSLATPSIDKNLLA